ncbi:AAA family ATPase [Sedimentibacter sp. zth1]|uniref:AAA family ATPase n=1 Tax=Sedimentibacter sp. zth1 TaxID=2816908 RepID=UPI001A921453|nr:AAA family ATPase [Sedimentibacter sp. zth1]QSX04683.1 AAA family ATPase [Sedimentibacter sp. zth1]
MQKKEATLCIFYLQNTSNVLFTVSTLVKNIIKDCLGNLNGIKQILILTHNVYFYKEITYRGSRENKSNDETYWIIKKKDGVSNIEQFEENPIKTTYELLWKDVFDSYSDGRVTVFNTMRRILEYYFNIIGCLNYEKLVDEFDGEEKIICKSLLSCINDSSHDVYDDFILCNETDTINSYINMFKLIFDKTGHIEHYNMMENNYKKQPLPI